MKANGGTETGSSFVEFTAGRADGGKGGVQQIPRDDILQYVQEMSATLSYMSIAHGCERLSGLLAAAAAEAERQIGNRATNEHARPGHIAPRSKETR